MVKSAPPKKLCFVICPIGKEGSASRKRSDKLLKYVVKAVFEPKGYKVERADQVGEPGMITNQIVKRIVECDVLLADLSESNPNVFYELAIRHGLKKPFIHIIDSSEIIPFDNAQVRTVQIDITDLDSVHRAKTELETQLEAIESNTALSESPISIAFDLESLKTSGNPDEALLANLVEEVSSMRREMSFARRNANPTMRRPRKLNSPSEMFGLLERYGEDNLASYIINNFDIDEFSNGSISMSTSEGGQYKDVDEELAQFLFRHTGMRWEVMSLPF